MAALTVARTAEKKAQRSVETTAASMADYSAE
jgi:hypothetical protein